MQSERPMQHDMPWTIADYQCTEPLYESQYTLVYRGYRQRDQLPVIIKMLKLADPTSDHVRAYQHEYQLLQRLQLPGVVTAYTFDTDQLHPFLVLEDFGGT